MDIKAKQIFDNNPKIKVIYKVKGKSIYFTTKEGKDMHVKETKEDVETISRLEDAEDKAKADTEAQAIKDAEDKAKADTEAQSIKDAEVKAKVEGNVKTVPDESWTIPEIQKWLTEKGVEHNKQAKEANLLSKVKEYLDAQVDPNAGDQNPE